MNEENNFIKFALFIYYTVYLCSTTARSLNLFFRVIAMLDQERQRIEQMTAEWDDPTQVDWGNEETEQNEPIDLASKGGTALRCTAIYNYTVG